MNEHLDQWLDAYLDNELDERQRSQVETHLAGCLHCQELLAQRRGLSALLQRVPAPQGLKPDARFAAEVSLLLGKRSPAKHSTLQELRQYLFNEASLNLGWFAVPLGLLLASIFIQTVSALSNFLALVPGPHQDIVGQLTMTQPAPVLANAQVLSGMLSGLGWFEMLQWNWVSELLAVSAISLLYLAWLAGWLVRTNQPPVLQEQYQSITGRQ